MTMTLDRTSQAGPTGDPPGVPGETAEPVLLHRRRGALLLVGVTAAAVAAAYLWRAVTAGGGTVAYLVVAALLPVALLHLAAWWDARIPLLMADETGLRLRQGRRWVGLRWLEVHTVRLAPARFPRRDANLQVTGATGADRSLPLAMVDQTDVRGLPDALRGLAPSRVDIEVRDTSAIQSRAAAPEAVAPEPVAPEPVAPEPTAPEPAGSTETVGAPVKDGHLAQPSIAPLVVGSDQADPDQTQVLVTPPRGAHPAAVPERRRRWWGARPSDGSISAKAGSAPAPTDDEMQELLSPQSLRDDSPRAARADVTMHGSSGATSSQSVVAGSSPAAPVELEEAGVAAATEQPSVWRTDDHVTSEPVADPVIGPQVAAARRSLRLSVDELGERTRVRPHVIEAIEVDDFSACGGDVYARGHLRVLARVLGIDADGLLETYDELYAAAPVTARSVLEADIAHSGRIPTNSGGPRWSVLVAAILVLALVWIAAQLLVPGADVDTGDATRSDAAGSQQADPSGAAAKDPAGKAAERFATMGRDAQSARLRLAAVPDAPTSTPVTVTAQDGTVLFQGIIAPGSFERIPIEGRTTIEAVDGGLILVQVDGTRIGPLGAVGEPVRRVVGG
ncbi:MAG: helix-turn-helix domain-containing protein [Actinomycetota bacterium]|nr:helix-turn-helix domain-containing protein [Actinomycetota bacterium]